VDEDCLIGAVAETFDLVAVIQACSTYLLRLTLPFVAFVPQFFLPIWQCSFLASSHRFSRHKLRYVPYLNVAFVAAAVWRIYQ
jgi:hypothetical protein